MTYVTSSGLQPPTCPPSTLPEREGVLQIRKLEIYGEQAEKMELFLRTAYIAMHA